LSIKSAKNISVACGAPNYVLKSASIAHSLLAGIKIQSPLFKVTLEYRTSRIFGNLLRSTRFTFIKENPPNSSLDSLLW